MATNIEYFMYARKSSESEDRQEQSIEDQINRLKERANQLGLSVKEILTESKSAKQPGRPVFNDMLKRIEKGEAKGILCWQINRLARNPIDSGKLSWMLQKGIIESIQTMEREYLPDDNVLLFSVESGMANQFIIELRKNTKRGMHGKADRGWFPSKAPAGYINERLEHTIQPDPQRFDLIRKMWDLMLTGNYTPVSIAEIASKEWGYRSLKSKRSGGVEMAPSVIYKMFKNIFYTGMFEWGKKIYKGNHKPMITLEEYDRVQAIFGRTGKPRGQTHEFSFTGLIRCGLCGSMYTGTEKTKLIKKTGDMKTYSYYHCGGNKKNSTCKKRNPITLTELEQQIELLLEEYTILPEFQTWAIEALNRNNDKEIEERTKIYEMQHKTVVDSQTELDNLTKMRYRDLIDDEMFVKERDTLKEKITRLQEKLRETEGRASKWLDLTEQVFSFACFARKEFVMGNLQKKREIFSALGQNFYIKDGKVFITANEWLQPIKEAYPEFRAEFERLGLREYSSVEARNVAFQQLILEWGAVVEDVRTVFEVRNDTTIRIPTFYPTPEFTIQTTNPKVFQRKICQSIIISIHMRKIIVITMITLDGVMQAPGGPKEDTSGGFKYGGWTAPYADANGSKFFSENMQPAEYLLGRKTFDIFAGYWPQHADVWPGINDGTKYVLSNAWDKSDWKNTVFLKSLADIKRLKNSNGSDLHVWGSSKLIQLLLKNDLVDELRLVTYPLTLGTGKRLFGDGTIPAAFILTESTVTPNGVVMANYRRAGEVKTGTVGS